MREIRHEVKSAINFGYFDVARKLINSLASEIRVIDAFISNYLSI
ncbi:MAG: hypothetical protein AAGK10_22660 [Cyanobacteria bacterium J06555_3]